MKKLAFLVFSFSLLNSAIAEERDSYFYVQNGKVSELVAEIEADSVDDCYYKEWQTKEGKKLRLQACFDFLDTTKSPKIIHRNTEINRKEALKVKRPKGVAEKFSSCYKEKAKNSAIYCVKYPFDKEFINKLTP